MFKVQTWYRDMFWEWCEQNKIICEYMGTSIEDPTNPFRISNLDTWYIGNERDRTLAILRWG